MYEIKIYDNKLGYVGSFRCQKYLDALVTFRDFLQAYFSVELFDDKGKLLRKQTVHQ